MRKRKLVVPYSASELDDLLDQMDTGVDDTDDDDDSDDVDDEGDDNLDDNADDDSDGEGDDPDGQPAQRKTREQLTNDGFAKLRIANRNLTQLLGKLATANGIEYNNTQELITKLNDSALEQISSKSKVPVELLREIEALRNDSAMLKQQQVQSRLEQGFKTLLDDYQLNEKQLRAFCAEMDSAGIDVSQPGFDLVTHYKTTHIDDIIEARVQAAVKAALEGDSSNDHASSPMRKRGSSGNSGGKGKINTVAALDTLLSGYSDK